MKKFIIFLVILFISVNFIACNNEQGKEEAKKGPVTIGTFIDSEGAVLGKMMVMLLEQEGYEIIDKTEFGTPDILRKALLAGEVNLVLDYTGSGQYYHDVEDTDIWSDAREGYLLTKKLDEEENNIIWLEPANANNTEALAVRREFSEANNIKNMEDFARYVNEGGTVKLICSASFAENIKGLRGFEEAYGFHLSAEQLIVLASGNTAEMLKALVEKTNGVNVSLVYGTDGALDKMDLVVLNDPKSIPPVYLPAPVLQGALYEKYPEIEKPLNRLFQSLNEDNLRQLNSKVAYDGMAAETVAREYLEENELLIK
ncbi:MAG: glycine betaine ABC transporter substrate-binding protein [Atribacterota bacterium]|jgi:osmoprotectant transport system substrate-binding protein|nr:glycine betaine ABC transporter substrate-binding protein [Atribacterota bacterium]